MDDAVDTAMRGHQLDERSALGEIHSVKGKAGISLQLGEPNDLRQIACTRQLLHRQGRH